VRRHEQGRRKEVQIFRPSARRCDQRLSMQKFDRCSGMPHRRQEHIGSVIRNANALGVEKVYVVDPRHTLPDDWQELRERGAISKLSVSASKWTFVKRFNSTDECFDYLERKNFTSIVTSPHVKGKASIFLHEGDYTVHSKLAVWFGSEAAGISDRAVERSDMCISIPMFGMIESLNLGTSSGIALYEITKQRREYQSKYRKRDKRGKRETPLATVMPPDNRRKLY